MESTNTPKRPRGSPWDPEGKKKKAAWKNFGPQQRHSGRPATATSTSSYVSLLPNKATATPAGSARAAGSKPMPVSKPAKKDQKNRYPQQPQKPYQPQLNRLMLYRHTTCSSDIKWEKCAGMGLNGFKYKTHARAFLPLNISAVGSVNHFCLSGLS